MVVFSVYGVTDGGMFGSLSGRRGAGSSNQKIRGPGVSAAGEREQPGGGAGDDQPAAAAGESTVPRQCGQEEGEETPDTMSQSDGALNGHVHCRWRRFSWQWLCDCVLWRWISGMLHFLCCLSQEKVSALENQANQLGLQASQECERLAKDRSLTLQMLQKVHSQLFTPFQRKRVRFKCYTLHDMMILWGHVPGEGEAVGSGEEIPQPDRRKGLPEVPDRNERGERPSAQCSGSRAKGWSLTRCCAKRAHCALVLVEHSKVGNVFEVAHEAELRVAFTFMLRGHRCVSALKVLTCGLSEQEALHISEADLLLNSVHPSQRSIRQASPPYSHPPPPYQLYSCSPTEVNQLMIPA